MCGTRLRGLRLLWCLVFALVSSLVLKAESSPRQGLDELRAILSLQLERARELSDISITLQQRLRDSEASLNEASRLLIESEMRIGSLEGTTSSLRLSLEGSMQREEKLSEALDESVRSAARLKETHDAALRSLHDYIEASAKEIERERAHKVVWRTAAIAGIAGTIILGVLMVVAR